MNNWHVIVLLFAWFLPFLTNAQTATITMSATGYEPVALQITPGTEVTFVNADTVDFWPATDHHPTHSLYDGTNLEEHCSQADHTTFDACGATKPGDSWSFVFPTAGVYRYHDHLWPHLKGQIVVGDTKTPTEPTGYWERFIAFGQSIVALVKGAFLPPETPELVKRDLPNDPYVRKVVEADPRFAIEALRSDSASSSELMARCHEVLHDIGKEAFYQYGSFGAASVYQSDFCNSGYIHGVFEAYFSTEGNTTSGLIEACESYATINGRNFDLWQCHHGVGHGLMYLTGGELPDALHLCSETFIDSKAIEDCHNGVYMELFNSEVLANEYKYLNLSEPAQICEKTTIAQGDCYHYLPTYFLQQELLTISEVFSVCDTIPQQYRDSCKLGVGAEMMKRKVAEPQTVIVECLSLASLRNQTVCAVGAISMYMNQTASLEESYRMCTKIPSIYERVCLEVVDSRVNDFKPAT